MLVFVLLTGLVRVYHRVRWHGHNQSPMLHALEANQQIGKLLHLG